MLKNTLRTIMAAASRITTSCATRQAISTADDLFAVLETIPRGQSRLVDIKGELRPYSGSSLKGKGLSEIAVGSQTILIHSLAIHRDREAPYLNKTVSAQVKISPFPLSDSRPASQIAGLWITDISDRTLTE